MSDRDRGSSEAATQVTAALLLYQSEGAEEAVAAAREQACAFAESNGIALEECAARTFFERDDGAAAADGERHWIVVGEDRLVRRAMEAAEGAGASLGLLPVGKLTQTRDFYDLPGSESDRLALAFRAPELALDVLRCNGDLVLGQATIGDVPFLDRRGQALVRLQKRFWRRWAMALSLFWTALRRLFVIRPALIRMQLGKEEKPRQTAVTGIVLLENDVAFAAGRILGESLSARDGRVSALLLAPTSIVRYLAFLLRAAFGGTATGARIPRALSYVRCESLVIESENELDYHIDGVRYRDRRIEVSVHAQSLRMNVGARFHEMAGMEDKGKDTLRLANLPENESRLAMIRKRLPLFTHALEEDFKDLFLLLKESARTGPDYVTLSLLAALIGTLGLLLNSAAVIIGAMVLAPLMAPIICLSMAALRRDAALFRQSGAAIGLGVGLSLFVSAALAFLLPVRLMTPEIAARVAPSLLDLGVAVFSGVAGAYAYARESLLKSLPGVAIAVALVPPLAVLGIGIGWGDLAIVGGAGLLFVTNLAGIALAGAATFMVLGYGPVKRTGHGLLWPAAVVVLIAIPLAVSFLRIQTAWEAERYITDRVFRIDGQAITLSSPDITVGADGVRINADIYGGEGVSAAHLQTLRVQLSEALGREVVLDVSRRQVYR